jgi:N-acetylmuramoyl-L-alanine amidase-like protein
MANPLSADMALKALREAGLKVVETRGWKTRNRNHKGPWGPVHGVMIHHTVSTGTQSTLNTIINGRPDLPGPLSQGLIAKDGTVYLTGWGRCNHAGLGDPDVLRAVIAETSLPKKKALTVDGNRHFYGFECVNLGDGDDPWPDAQVRAMVMASAALIRAHGWGRNGPTSVIGHSEWQLGKIDPYPLSMPEIREQVANAWSQRP